MKLSRSSAPRLAAALLAGLSAAACRKGEAVRQNPGVLPARIAADYGRTWVRPSDWGSLHPRQRVIEPDQTDDISETLLDYYACESIVRRDPAVCGTDGLGRIPSSYTGMLSLHNHCLLISSEYLMLAELMQGRDIQDTCPIFLSDGDPAQPQEREKQACAAAAQAYRSAGFSALCPTFKRLAPDRVHSCSMEALPDSPGSCRGQNAAWCEVSAAIIAALRAKKRRLCPSELNATCQALVDLLSHETAAPRCRRAAEKLGRLYQAAPRMTFEP
ncbi:MAG: hypothetical protein PHF00_05115 [Elusimicrobia bacterium]|nr:hypothetical protein [Elusimicrobiota bacterium]